MKNGKKLFATYLVIMCAYLFLTVSTAQAVTFTVTKTADTDDGVCAPNDCSLREAIFVANSLATADIIDFAPGVFAPPNPVQQIILSLNLPELFIDGDLTINGPGARQLLINGNADDRVFSIEANHQVSIRDLAIINGKALATEKFPDIPTNCDSGGIRNKGNLTLSRVRIHLNQADCGVFGIGGGGGIGNSGSLTVLYSVISGNSTKQSGGGIFSGSGDVKIANSTISDNEAKLGGGGIRSSDKSALYLNNATISHNSSENEAGGIAAENTQGIPSNKWMRNTIVANNTAPQYQDILGIFQSQGSNWIRINSANISFTPGSPNNKGDYVGVFVSPLDPMLGPLQDNGGLSNTRALLSGSPAIDKGNSCVTFPANCAENKPPIPLVYDQRFTGFNRNVGAVVDIGAYEAEFAPTAAEVMVGGRVTTQDGRGIRNVSVTITFPTGEQRTVLSGALGYYRFAEVPAGATYFFRVAAKRYSFSQPTQIRDVADDVRDIDFIADAPLQSAAEESAPQ